MTIKKKLITTISAFSLVTAILLVGVWALKTTSFDIGGNISFTATGINATISKGTLSSTGSWVTPDDADEKLKEIVINTDKTQTQINSEFISWQGLDLLFNENADDVTITFSITNDSEVAGEYIWVDVSINNGTMKNAIASISTSSTTLAPNETKEFVITFKVLDKTANASLSGFNLHFDMQLAKDGVEASTLTDLAFTYDNTTMTASVKGNNASATSITIPEFVTTDGKLYVVTTLGEEAFKSYTLLKTLILPNTLKQINKKALSELTALEYNTYEQGKYIGASDNAYFVLCELEDKTISQFNSFHENTKMTHWTFSGCTNLTSVTIPSSVVYIGDSTFYQCTSLTEIVIPEGVNKIDRWAFGECSALKTISLPQTLKYIGDSAFYQTGFETISIPDNVTVLDRWSFGECPNLKSIDMPSSLSVLGESAFYNSPKLESIIMPDAVENIEQYTFGYCTSLKEIRLPRNLKNIGLQAFIGDTALSYLYLPSELESIGKYAFYQCKSLTGDIVLPTRCTTIYDGAFHQCSSINKVYFPETIKNIPYACFSDCTSIDYIYLPESLEVIGGFAFSNCQKAKFDLPTKLKQIGNAAFQNCCSLKEIKLASTLEFIGDYAFNHCYGATNETITMPAGIKQLGGKSYDPANPSTTVIGSHVFYDCGTNNLKAFELDASNEYYMVVDGVLYRKENGVPTVLVAYPADKRDVTYTMPDTVENAYELSMSRPFYLREIVLSDNFVIKEMTDGEFNNSSWANNLHGMIYIYSGITTITCKDTNPNYMSYNGQVYSKDGTTIYYAPHCDGTLYGDSTQTTMTFKDGLTTLFHGSFGYNKAYLKNFDGHNTVESVNQFKRYDKVVIPASVTTIDDQTITAINAVGWTIEVVSGNTAFQVVDGKLARI